MEKHVICPVVAKTLLEIDNFISFFVLMHQTLDLNEGVISF